MITKLEISLSISYLVILLTSFHPEQCFIKKSLLDTIEREIEKKLIFPQFDESLQSKKKKKKNHTSPPKMCLPHLSIMYYYFPCKMFFFFQMI